MQDIIGKASTSIVDSALLLLQSMHVEVQYEACELIKDLMNYDIKEDLMHGLVALLHPTPATIEKIPKELSGMLIQLYFLCLTWTLKIRKVGPLICEI